MVPAKHPNSQMSPSVFKLRVFSSSCRIISNSFFSICSEIIG